MDKSISKMNLRKTAAFALFVISVVCLFIIPANDSANWLSEIFVTKGIAIAGFWAIGKFNLINPDADGTDTDADNN